MTNTPAGNPLLNNSYSVVVIIEKFIYALSWLLG